MKTHFAAELVLLAALWGASFLFMRVAAPEFGAVPLAFVRVALAAAVLLPWLAWQGGVPPLRQHWRRIATLGVINSALPFVAFSYAALAITGGLSAVVNATAPLWGAIVAWLWLHERAQAERLAGLVLGFAGVAWLMWDQASFKAGALGAQSSLAMLACLAATACYGVAANFTRRNLTGVPPLAIASGSQLAAALLLALPAWWLWPAKTPHAAAWWATFALGGLCTALAYVLFFRLVAHGGATKALTVTFLIPLFGMAWGALFLGETVTPVMLLACLLILAGTSLAGGLLSWRNGAAALK